MSEDEIVVSILMGIAAVSMFPFNHSFRLHPLFFEKNGALGLLRLIVPLALGWVLFVIHFFGDPSITGIYIGFYLLMGYVATKLFGMLGARLFGIHLRDDVYERKNLAAAIFIASFALSTALIFGGSLWGEADPVGDGEGGWWIPVTFFLFGWVSLVLAVSLYIVREGSDFSVEIRQNRSVRVAKAVSVYTLSTASVLVDGVAGDFFGWGHGLLTFATVAGMLIVHELILTWASPDQKDPGVAGRWWEVYLYPLLALLAFVLNRWLDTVYGAS